MPMAKKKKSTKHLPLLECFIIYTMWQIKCPMIFITPILSEGQMKLATWKWKNHCFQERWDNTIWHEWSLAAVGTQCFSLQNHQVCNLCWTNLHALFFLTTSTGLWKQDGGVGIRSHYPKEPNSRHLTFPSPCFVSTNNSNHAQV